MKIPTAHPLIPKVTTIEFDDVAPGTVIDTHYQSRGATFQTVTNHPPGQSSVFAVFSTRARTTPNTVSVDAMNPGFDRSLGGIQVTFDQPVFGASIYALPYATAEILDPDADNRPFLEAFDVNGNLIMEKIYPFPWSDPINFGSWENLVVTSAVGRNFVAKIKSVIFSSQRAPIGVPYVHSEFDTLQFWHY